MKIGGYKIDIWILIPVLLLLMFSIGLVYSASSDYSISKFKDANYMFKLHLIKVLMALVLIFIFAKIDYKYYQKYSKWLILISIFSLVLVFIIGISIKNVNRWLNFGPVSFQPSDLAKYTLILFVANLLVKQKNKLTDLYKGYLPLIITIITVSVLVAAQPNFSTSLIIFGSSMLLLLISRVKLKHILITGISILPAAVFFVFTKSYIRSRIENYADFTSSGTAQHQLNQAIIGLGNGGILGVGGGNSLQKQFYLPEAHGDFIFSIIGEEYGFLGTLAVIFLFAILLIRGYKVAKKIPDEYGKYVAFGITTLITAYAVVNMSVACGIIPTTGVPIPFISYGGTALIFNSIAVGILLNISSYRNESSDAFSDEVESSSNLRESNLDRI
ncbi:MAG: putative peptidoglycan glycosyltransferase FtsW [Ignavibacteriae bacterium]|nr:putative peptidoglycan glycosyltransferase FtsW [Ignavibacteriota bacterium]